MLEPNGAPATHPLQDLRHPSPGRGWGWGGRRRKRLVGGRGCSRNRGMIRAGKISLRARTEADVPILHAELHEDVATEMRASSHAWQPVALGPSSPYALREPSP